MDQTHPHRIGPYSVLREIGRGGMGVVLLAHDTRLDRLVALKSLPSHLADDPEATDRLLREGRILAALDHPNVATLFGIKDHEGSRYLVLEYVQGEGLDDRLNGGALPLDEALSFSRQIAGALEAAHFKGIVHRDLKPGNVRITPEGRCKVLDFGLAKPEPDSGAPHEGEADSATAITEEGTILGTLGYMSPEQLDDLPLDARTDVWALGCVLFECLTGDPAFPRDAPARSVASVLRDEPAWDALPEETPSGIRELLRRCLEKDRSRRPADCGEVRAQLDSALATPSVPETVRLPRRLPRHNLPSLISSFVGREGEVREVLNMLTGSRLLTLTGPGGCGKSRLALQVAGEIAEDFRDGVWLAELVPLKDPGLVPQAVASLFGLKEAGGRPFRDLLLDYLEGKNLLLLLDNCERLLEACAGLADGILRRCPDVHIIATSQQALGTEGERTFHVPPLSLPAEEESDPEGVLRSEAARLFVDRARAVEGGFSLTTDSAPTVGRICRRLDGIPLAIELAAARTQVLEVGQIADRLSGRFHLLKSGARTSLPHHRTLRAAIEWSHDLLSEPEKILFRRQAVFAGGWTLESLEAVASGDGIEREDVLDLLSTLVDKSLVVVERGAGEARYRYLESIGEYALERLRESEEEGRLRARHLRHFLALAEEADAGLHGPGQRRRLEHLEREHDNFRSAIRLGHEDDDSLVPALSLAATLGEFHLIRGFWAEGYEALRGLLATEGPDLPPDARAWGLARAGRLAIGLGKMDVAKELCDEARETFEAGTNREGLAACLSHLGILAAARGEMAEARSLFERSRDLSEEAGDVCGVAAALGNLGMVERVLDRQDDAVRHLEECHRLYEEMGDRLNVARGLLNLGALASDRNRLVEARDYLERGRESFRELGAVFEEARCRIALGHVALQQGDPSLATTHLEEALAITEELGDSRSTAQTLYRLGKVARHEGDHARSRTFYERSLAVCSALEDRRGVNECLFGLGLADLLEGDVPGARARFEECLALSREIQSPWAEAICLHHLGSIACREGDTTSARERLRRAAIIYRETGHDDGVAVCLIHAAALALALGRVEQAARLLGAADGIMDPVDAELGPYERGERERVLETVREVLGREAFPAAWEEGQALSLDEALNLALKDGD